MSSIVDTFWQVMSIAVPVGLAAAYYKRVHRLGVERRPVPGWRQACFLAGMIVIAAAIASPVEEESKKLVFVHMIQHLLLADIASLLIVFGFTGPLLQPLLKFRAGRPLRVLTHPVVAISIFTFNLYLWHTPPLYDAVLRSESLHVLEHLLFIGTGILLWMPLVRAAAEAAVVRQGRTRHLHRGHLASGNGAGQRPDVVGHRLLSRLLGDLGSGRDRTDRRPVDGGGDPDVECTILALCIFGWVFLRWAKEDIEKQDLLDLAIDQDFELTPARADRAVAAGRGPELRARIESGGSQPVSPAATPGPER